MDWSVLTDPDANLGDDARAALAILEKNIDHPGVVHSLISSMRAWRSHKDHAEAERLGKRVLPVFERTLGILHDDTRAVVVELGHALEHQHKRAEADQLYDRWLQAAEAAWGPAHSRVNLLVGHIIYEINVLARSLLWAGNTPEAESMFCRALTLAERLPDGYDRTVLLELGNLYGKQGRYEEAEKLLRRCRSKAAHDDTQVAEALGDILRKTGREKEAEQIEEPAQRLHWYLNP